MRKIEIGDYVLASKWRDGKPSDPWAVGFVSKLRLSETGTSYWISDENGNLVYHRNLKRAERISSASGYILIEARELVENDTKSVWYWKNNVTQLYGLYDFMNDTLTHHLAKR